MRCRRFDVGDLLPVEDVETVEANPIVQHRDTDDRITERNNLPFEFGTAFFEITAFDPHKDVFVDRLAQF